MTYLAPGAGTQPAPPGAISHQTAPHAGAHLDSSLLRLGLLLRREVLDELETELIEACEAAAGLGDSHRTSDPADRSGWDRAAWDGYLDAAVRLEGSYGPRMRRLRGDIARLERLLDLATAG